MTERTSSILPGFEDREHAIDCSQGKPAKQSFRDECNINNIVPRYMAGDLTHVSTAMPQFGDFTQVPDLQGAFEQLAQAEALFMKIPAETRRKFDNDPGKLISWLDDPSNAQEAIDLDLAPGEKTKIVPTAPEPIPAPALPEPITGGE